MKRIEQNGDLIALIIDAKADFKPGVHFISDPAWPLQIGLLAHRGGHSPEKGSGSDQEISPQGMAWIGS